MATSSSDKTPLQIFTEEKKRAEGITAVKFALIIGSSIVIVGWTTLNVWLAVLAGGIGAAAYALTFYQLHQAAEAEKARIGSSGQ